MDAGAQRQGGVIGTEAELDAGMAALAALCPRMAGLAAAQGRPPLRRRPAGFEGLAHVIVFQQISTRAAEAIWARSRATFGTITPEVLAAADDDAYRAAGQSRPKMRTLRAAAVAVRDGTLDLDALAAMSAAEAEAALTRVSGIGPWTAQVYLLTCLGHGDAWPAGDIALQAACADVLGLASRPDRMAMEAIGERWRPHRAIAARLLWARYAVMKGRPGAPVTAA